MDGNGTLYGTLAVRYHLYLQSYKRNAPATKDILGVCIAEQGSTRDVLHKFTVDLPKKHGRGGQSALRFARLRMEKRHNYVRKVRAADETLVYTTEQRWRRSFAAREPQLDIGRTANPLTFSECFWS